MYIIGAASTLYTIDESMQHLEIDHLKDRFIDQLSGGQRQMAFIAMVVAQDTDYIFLDEAEFQRWIDADRFLEYAQVFGRSWYGTPREPVEADLAQGKIVVLDIDVQGAIQVHETMPSSYGIFVLPPSEDELLQRLRHRGREDEETIERRFAEARHEMQTARTCTAYEEFVVNDDLEKAALNVIELVRLRRSE